MRLLVGVLVAGLAWGCAGGHVEEERPPLNGVILVDIDTLRADRLGVYGNERPVSPAIDRFASQAVRFEWAFAQAAFTLPSQSSILTGLLPQSHGVQVQGDRLSPDAVLLAELFRDAGWRTGGFVDGGYLSAHFGFDQGFETFFDARKKGLAVLAPQVATWLRANAEQPFFLFVHSYDVHTPYAPGEPYRSRFAEMTEPPNPGFEPTSQALEEIRASQWSPPFRQLDARDLAYALAMYDGGVAEMDAWFGELLALVDELGVADTTAIVLISDHGEEFQEHGSLLHEKLYATVTRVPLIVRLPGGGRGVVERRPVATVDLVPTLLDLAGLPVDRPFDGRSLATLLWGEERGPSPLVLSHSALWGGQRAAIDDRHHLIVSLEGPRIELYDYRADPLELVDLAERQPDLARDLARRLHARAAAAVDSRGAVEHGVELSDEVSASLRALGYLQ